jgi:ketosteroid isomerase-like protein
MRFLALLSLGVLLGSPMVRGEEEAKPLAEKVTAEGAKHFSARDAQALSESYTDDAVLFLVTYDQSTGRAKVADTKEGRSAIRSLYEDLFRDGQTIDAHNEVEYARLVGPDYLIIAGTFEMKRGLLDVSRLPFVQTRIRQGDRWLIQSMRVAFMPNQE